MPRDLFGDVIDPSIKLGTRKWYSVPLSFLAHTAAIGLFVVTPLLATGALPMPSARTIFMTVETPPLPQPPPVRRASTSPPAAVNRDAAPVVAPDDIAPEPELPPSIEKPHSDFGVVGGVPVDVAAVVTPPPPIIEEPAPTKVRPGGQIRTPERVNYVGPIYPPVALAARVQGVVIIEATIDPAGRVQDARILRSASPLLNEAALDAVRQWSYTPTLLNGVPVSVVMTVTVSFQLK